MRVCVLTYVNTRVIKLQIGSFYYMFAVGGELNERKEDKGNKY